MYIHLQHTCTCKSKHSLVSLTHNIYVMDKSILVNHPCFLKIRINYKQKWQFTGNQNLVPASCLVTLNWFELRNNSQWGSCKVFCKILTVTLYLHVLFMAQVPLNLTFLACPLVCVGFFMCIVIL